MSQPNQPVDSSPEEVTPVAASPFPRSGTEAGIEPHELTQRATQRGSTAVTCVDYSPERIQITEVADLAEFVSHHRPEWTKVRWISVRGLTDMEVLRVLAEKYGLHPLAIEDVLSPQRPKAEDFPGEAHQPGRLFVVARGVRPTSGRLQSKQISLFLGRNTLLSFEEHDCNLFETIRARLQKPGSRIRQNDASFLLYGLLDVLIDDMFPQLENLSQRVDSLEKSMLANPTPQAFVKIRHLKHDLIELRRVAWPMRELVSDLRRDPHECLSATTQTYMRDVYDHIMVIFEMIENYRDLLSDLLDTYMSAVAQRTNAIVKVLTIISTIFVPLTFFAGVYGMNMPIPENKSEFTYPIFWAFCLSVIVGMLYWFRRKKWL
ncbi:MAG: magnesium/cobalt transporter CorA [Planctomycetes bacterium]|nr:magnesium/cobalt transporter CorA [Planctomycetota bacterium]